MTGHHPPPLLRREMVHVGEILGQRIRRVRQAKGYGLRELARLLKISPTYLSRVETNEEKRPPGEEVLRHLARYLDDDFDELMSLAGRVPKDLKEFIAKDPGLSRFLRAVRDRRCSAAELRRMLQAWKDEE